MGHKNDPEGAPMSTAPTARYHAAWHRRVRRFAQRVIARILIKSVVRVKVEGKSNVRGLTEPFIVVANHSSHLDAPVLITHLPYDLTRQLATAVAADYFYSQKWRSTLTSFFFNSYPVEREGKGKKGGRRSKYAGMSVSLLRQDIPLMIFPEGSRSRDGQMRDFKPGAAALARALRVPIIPVALVGCHEAMPVGTSWPKAGRKPVKVLIGKPVRVRPGEKLDEFNDRVRNRVAAMHRMQTPTVIVTADKPGDDLDAYSQSQEDVS